MKTKRFIAGIVAAGALAVALPMSAGAAGPPGHPGGPYDGNAWGKAVSANAPGGWIGCHASGGMAATCPDEQ